MFCADVGKTQTLLGENYFQKPGKKKILRKEWTLNSHRTQYLLEDITTKHKAHTLISTAGLTNVKQ